VGTDIAAAGLLVDMDGVLIDSRAAVEGTWRRWAARHAMSAESNLQISHGRRTRDTLRLVAPHFATEEEVAWLESAGLEDFDGAVSLPGAAALVASRPSSGWTVVTSAGRELAIRRLASAGIALHSHAVTSEDVKRGEPDPAGYLLAADYVIPDLRALQVSSISNGLAVAISGETTGVTPAVADAASPKPT
jgi:sugar-phosphatase